MPEDVEHPDYWDGNHCCGDMCCGSDSCTHPSHDPVMDGEAKK